MAKANDTSSTANTTPALRALDVVDWDLAVLRANVRAARSMLQQHPEYESSEELCDVGTIIMDAEKRVGRIHEALDSFGAEGGAECSADILDRNAPANEYQQLKLAMTSKANPLIGLTIADTSNRVQSALKFLSLATGGLNNGFGIAEMESYGFSLVLDVCAAALEFGDIEGLSATRHQPEGSAA